MKNYKTKNIKVNDAEIEILKWGLALLSQKEVLDEYEQSVAACLYETLTTPPCDK